MRRKTSTRVARISLLASLVACAVCAPLRAQMGTATPLSAAEREKAAAEQNAKGLLPDYPQLVDIAAATGIHFDHKSSPEAKFIAESMSGGVALIDYDGDGLWAITTTTDVQTCL